LDIEKQLAANIYKKLSDLDIQGLNNLKPKRNLLFFKEENVYTASSYSIPLELTIENAQIKKIIIPSFNDFINEKVVYDSSSEEKQTIKDHTLLDLRRKALPNVLEYQIEKVLGDNSEVRLPVTLPHGEDSWLVLKLNENTFYYEVKADVMSSQGNTTSRELKFIRTEEEPINHLEMDGDIVVQ
jgi:hypothetical protein